MVVATGPVATGRLPCRRWVYGSVRRDQFRRLARSAITDLFDQRRPFGRLALTQVLMTAGDTLFAVSLAGSLFFSVSPTRPRTRSSSTCCLPWAPSPWWRRSSVRSSTAAGGPGGPWWWPRRVGRAALCPFLARDIHSLLLFPEAFAMLVLSKVYLVTKGALVPEMAALGMLDGPPATEATGRATGTRPTRRGRAPSDVGPRPGPSPAVGPGPTPPLPTGCRSSASTIRAPAESRAGPGHPQRPAGPAGLALRPGLRHPGRGHPRAGRRAPASSG